MKMISLYLRRGSNSWKALIKLVKRHLGTTLIGSIVSEIFNLKDISKLLSPHFRNVFEKFEVL